MNFISIKNIINYNMETYLEYLKRQNLLKKSYMQQKGLINSLNYNN